MVQAIQIKVILSDTFVAFQFDTDSSDTQIMSLQVLKEISEIFL